MEERERGKGEKARRRPITAPDEHSPRSGAQGKRNRPRASAVRDMRRSVGGTAYSLYGRYIGRSRELITPC